MTARTLIVVINLPCSHVLGHVGMGTMLLYQIFIDTVAVVVVSELTVFVTTGQLFCYVTTVKFLFSHAWLAPLIGNPLFNHLLENLSC